MTTCTPRSASDTTVMPTMVAARGRTPPFYPRTPSVPMAISMIVNHPSFGQLVGLFNLDRTYVRNPLLSWTQCRAACFWHVFARL